MVALKIEKEDNEEAKSLDREVIAIFFFGIISKISLTFCPDCKGFKAYLSSTGMELKEATISW